MPQPIDDKNVILIIIATILFIFILIFSFIPKKFDYNNDIQWKETSYIDNEYSQI